MARPGPEPSRLDPQGPSCWFQLRGRRWTPWPPSPTAFCICKKEAAVWAPLAPQIFTDSVPGAGPGAKALGSGPGRVHYSCLSRARRPWARREGEAAGARLTLPGGGARHTVAAACRSAHSPPAGQESGCIPKAQACSQRRGWGTGGGRGPPRLLGSQVGGGSCHACLPGSDYPAPQEWGLPQGQAGLDKLLLALHPGREAVPGGRADRKK